jgi:peptidoglycan/xylan/chitin deacetylase (PgdA/CDA1 family)
MTDVVPRLTVALTFDHDAISSEVDRGDGPVLRSRGEFGPRVGAPRILALLEREAIPSTWFVPGHTIVTFPDSVAAIVADGHEIGCHGWAHEDLASLDHDAERSVMERSVEAVARVSGRAPRGFRAPYWSLSERTLDLAVELGLAYDSSLMADDVHLYRVRRGDVHDPRSGSRFGSPGPLVEVPVSWALDDWPHFEPGAKGVGPMSPASKVEEIWVGELGYAWEREPGGLLTITMHPEAIGRGHRLLMLERFISAARALDGVVFDRLDRVVERWSAANPIPA